jgi:hypothetical protein
MRKWPTRLLTATAILFFALIVFCAATFTLYKSTPTWYSTPISPEQRAALAQQAEEKVTETQNWAALLHGDVIRAQRASATSRPPPATRVTDVHEIRFTTDELGALFDKWSTLNDWQSHYNRYVENPRLIIQKDHLILAAGVKDLGTITSFHFAPRLDAVGQLHLDLVRVMGGRLPLPDMLWQSQKENLVGQLESRIPTWQPTARIDADGAASESAMWITLSRLVIHAAHNQPADPILFLPLTDSSKSVPVKLTALSLDEGSLTLQVQKLTPQERTALLTKLQSQ